MNSIDIKKEQARIWQRQKWFLTKDKERFFPDPNKLNEFIGKGAYFDQKIQYIEHTREGSRVHKLGDLHIRLAKLISYKDNDH